MQRSLAEVAAAITPGHVPHMAPTPASPGPMLHAVQVPDQLE